MGHHMSHMCFFPLQILIQCIICQVHMATLKLISVLNAPEYRRPSLQIPMYPQAALAAVDGTSSHGASAGK